MARSKRQRVEPTGDWHQLQLLSRFPEQLTYELLRPVVLFGHSPVERARQTGAPERTLYWQAARFEHEGMASLFAPTPTRQSRLPDEVRRAIVALKAEYPPFRPNELATICEVRFGRRASSHSIKRLLAEESPPIHAGRRFVPYHQMTVPAERRLDIIRLHSEGWNKRSIAGCLDISRETVHVTFQRWIDEGVWGLDDKSHARKDGVRKDDLRTMLLVRDLQEDPELGEYRIHTALKQLGIELSPRACGRILARNGRLYGLPTPPRVRREPKAMPFKASQRQQYWTVDLFYLHHQLDDGKVYCISILENYSRTVLVSDPGGVFRAKQTQRI